MGTFFLGHPVYLFIASNSFALLLILLAWVGVMVEMSSLAKLFRIVVLPALSRPRSKILNSRSGDDLSFLKKLDLYFLFQTQTKLYLRMLRRPIVVAIKTIGAVTKTPN